MPGKTSGTVAGKTSGSRVCVLTGEALATNSRIAKLAFTGSTATGTRILEAAAKMHGAWRWR